MNNKGKHIADLLFVIGLFVVFAMSAFGVVAAGSEVYQNITDNMSSNYRNRTAGAYIVEKIRANDALIEEGVSGVQVTELADTPALCLRSVVDENRLCTFIYCHGGYLRELTVLENYELGGDPLEAGEKLFEAESLETDFSDSGLLHFVLRVSDEDIYENAVLIKCR